MKKVLILVLLGMFSFNTSSGQSPVVVPVPEGWSLPKRHYDYVMPEFTEHISLLRKCFGAEEGVTTVPIEKYTVTFKWDENGTTFSFETDGVWVSGVILPTTFGVGIVDTTNQLRLVEGVEYKEAVTTQFDAFLRALGCKE